MKKSIKKIFRYFGFDIVRTLLPEREGNAPAEVVVERHDKNTLISNAFTLLKYKGFNPAHVVDVGANHGNCAREVLKVFPNSNYTLIEPQSWLSESFSDLLQEPNFIFLPIDVVNPFIRNDIQSFI